MHSKSNPHHTGIKALKKPSDYLAAMHYDTILHDPQALNYLKEKVGVSQILLGTDDSFPPADSNPLKSLNDAQFSNSEIEQITIVNPKRLFKKI
jgi:aminocarboxymuconate-semialdehyde decarboxylase